MSKTEDELKSRVRETPLVERLERSRSMIGKMCKEGRPPRMCIPVQYDDEDFFITTTLRDAKAEIEKPVRIELTDDVKQILGRPNFMCGNIAIKLRALGQSIPHKAEEEQAAVLCWMLNLYLEHGEDYCDVGNEILRSAPLAAVPAPTEC